MNTKRLILALLAMVLTATTALAVVETGSCGKNATYTLDTETGLLKIEGTGNMWDYSANTTNYGENITAAPWCTYYKKVTKIMISDGITSIGQHAFCGCSGVLTATIPNSVTKLGNSAFQGCSSLKSISIPESITDIGDFTFQDCVSMTSLTFPNSVLVIGYCSFRNCCRLTSLVIPNSVTRISGYAFKDCFSLTTVSIGSSVNTILGDAFIGCTALKKVYNYSELKLFKQSSQNGYVAYYANAIITQPTSRVGDFVYYADGDDIVLCDYTGNDSILSLPENIDGKNYKIGNSAFYNCKDIKSVEIPVSARNIGETAFYGCSGLTYAIIPNSISYVSGNAFNGITLDTINVNITDFTIANKLKDVINSTSWVYSHGGATVSYIPEGTTSLGEYVLYNNKDLKNTTLPEGLVDIGRSAFEGCTNLTSVVIPKSVTSIGTNAFYKCTELKKVYNNSNLNMQVGTTGYGYIAYYARTVVTQPTSEIGDFVYYIEGNDIMLSDYTGTSNIPTLPANIDGKRYKIGSCAFYGRRDIDAIVIPNTVTSIESCAFSNTRLKSLTIGSGVISIASDAFSTIPVKTIWLPNTPPNGYGCAIGNVNYVSNNQYGTMVNMKQYKYLTSIFEVEGVKYAIISPTDRTCDVIDCSYDSIYKDISIQEAVSYKGITMTVKTVNQYAFYENNTTETVLLANEGDVEKSAFYGCARIKNLIAENNGSIGDNAFSNCTGIQTAKISNHGDLGTYAFSNCTSLESAEASNSGHIGKYAFSNCTNMKSANLSNNGNIGDLAFTGCKNLLTTTISNHGDVGKNAFSNCTCLERVEICNDGSIGSQAFMLCANLEYANVSCKGDIDNSAFRECVKLKDLTLGAEVKSMGNEVFYCCSMLPSVSIPNSVASVGARCFYNNTALANVTIGKGVKALPESVFQNCSSLASISIPQNVTSLGDDLLSGCTGLKTVAIEDRNQVLSIGNSNKDKPFFYDCPLDSVYIGGKISYNSSSYFSYSPFYRNLSLRSVKITDEEDTIYNNEFYGCTGLENVKIGDGVQKIGEWAFSGCSALKYFNFGTGLRTIGKEAFSDCSGVTSLVSHAVIPPTCGSQALEDISKWDCTLYVPAESIDEYQSADQWRDFFFVNDNSGVDPDEEEEDGTFAIEDGAMLKIRNEKAFESIKYTRTFASTDWEPLYVPFAMKYEDWQENFEVADIYNFHQYDMDGDGVMDDTELEVTVLKSGVLEPNIPYLIRAKSAGEYNIKVSDGTVYPTEENSIFSASTKATYNFTGTYSATEKDCYTLQNGELVKATATIQPQRWYMTITPRGTAKADAPARIRIRTTEDYVDAITLTPSTESTETYDLQGRKVKNARNGLFIQNGRVVLMK